MNNGRITIDDVAKRAGYSRATISRVINNDRRVRPSTMLRVKEVIEELGFVPNAVAAALSGGKTRTVGVLLPDISSPYYSNLLEGIDHVAIDRRYHIILKTKHSIKGVLELLETNKVDGLLIRHSRDPEDDATLVNRLRALGIPFIFIGKPIGDEHADAIMVDNVGGAREMAHHFVEHGFRSILFISGKHENLDSRDRTYGFSLGLTESHFDMAQLQTVEGDFSRECGYDIAGELLSNRRFEAVFAANDRMALGVLLYCHEHGLRVPDDVAVAGFDDAFFSEYLWPPLTTVRQPMHEIGTVAMENMIMAIEGSRLSTSRIILPTRLVRRRSCGCSFDHFGADRNKQSDRRKE